MINRKAKDVEGVNLTSEHHTNFLVSDLAGGVGQICVEPLGSFCIEVQLGVKLQVRFKLSNRIALLRPSRLSGLAQGGI
jgi:hypothetical protein